jgi:hypothetical protein
MLKSLLLITAVAATLGLTGVASARSHTFKAPQTLLSLYRDSDTILIGRFDKTVENSAVSETSDHSVIAVNEYFDITSSLKGENIKIFVLQDSRYKFHSASDARAATVSDSEDFDIADSDDGLRSGDTVLLFLRKKGTNGGFELTDRSEGVKKLSDEDLAVYQRRISELNSIFDSPNADENEIVQWLVRCAAEPATRWEGAFELLQSSERLAWQKKQTPACIGTLCQTDNDLAKTSQSDTATLARSLTDDQRNELLDILFSTGNQQTDTKGQKMFVRGDRELLELAGQWGDNRLATFLIDRLNNRSTDAYENAQVIAMIAKTFKDPQIADLIAKYNSADPAPKRDAIKTKILNRCQAIINGGTAGQTAEN